MTATIHLGFEVGTGQPIAIPKRYPPSASQPTRAELITTWRGRVKPHAGSMLEAIAKRNGQWITTERLSADTGITPGNGHWYAGIAAIRDPGLIVQDGDRFKLSDFVAGLS